MSQSVPVGQRSAALRCYHRRAERFAALGLNRRGKAYGRRPNFTEPAARLESQRRHGRLKWQRAAAQHRRAGLTTRGGQPVLRRNLRRELLREIEAVAAVAKSVFPAVPPLMQHRLLDLAERLVQLRRRIE